MADWLRLWLAAVCFFRCTLSHGGKDVPVCLHSFGCASVWESGYLIYPQTPCFPLESEARRGYTLHIKL